jgi:hypothetical protein
LQFLEVPDFQQQEYAIAKPMRSALNRSFE